MKTYRGARFAAGLIALAAAGIAHAQVGKLDGALSSIAASGGRSIAADASAMASGALVSRRNALAMRDASGRILVDVFLDGSVSLPDFLSQLSAMGAEVTGVEPNFRNGAVSAYVPVAALTTLGSSSGLHLAKMSLRPQRNVGAVTSQGTTIMRSDLANASGYSGTGITVGVLSDSYNGSTTGFTTVRAANDIASNDLKAPKLVIDLPVSGSNTDEGRAMMQIVHDVAPAADLCFATAFSGEAAFAANIRTLRTNAACNADVIVDDVFYFDEPFFSDGMIAQAVNDVSTSTSLAGKKVAYFSSAGNQGFSGGGGSIDVPNATFSTTPTGLGNINLATTAACFNFDGLPTGNAGGGWLDFGGGTYFVTVTYNASAGATAIMQWDDLFYSGAVTTDLDFYLFDASGNCYISFVANNFGDDNAIEVPGFSGGASGTYRIMVARKSGGSQAAKRVRLVNLDGWGGAVWGSSSKPTTFGHSAAANANSVAAYRYTFTTGPFTPGFEPFSSPGPVTIAFDAAGNRLAAPEIRKKPDMAAPDGGNTTFFYPGQDYEGDGFPNFFGTSAAAPHAAGVAALLLQKAGGPNSLDPKQIKSILQTTAPARKVPFGGAALVKTWSLYDGFGLIDAVNALNKLP